MAMLGVQTAEGRRQTLSREIDREFKSTIQVGPLSGFCFEQDASWSVNDRGSMILGLYEQEIVGHVSRLLETRSVLIDIGAADGFYGIGCVASKLCERSVCFESQEWSRDILQRTARLNAVSDKVRVLGAFNLSDLASLGDDFLRAAVVLIDVEGAEFDIVTEAFLDLCAASSIIIELHDWCILDGETHLSDLRNRIGDRFTITEVTTGARDLSGLRMIGHWSDTDRWLLCSEGRERLMTWWVLEPTRMQIVAANSRLVV